MAFDVAFFLLCCALLRTLELSGVERRFQRLAFLCHAAPLLRRIRESDITTGNLGILHSVKIPQALSHPTDYFCDCDGIDVLIGTEDVSPYSSGQNVITPDDTLVVGEQAATPLNEQIFEILVAHAASRDVVEHSHAVFGGVGEVI